MLCLLADENFNKDILRGLLRIIPELDICRVQDVGLAGIADPIILEWATQENRIVLTHDVNTMIGYANARIEADQSMSGLVAVRSTAPLGAVIEDLLMLIMCSNEGELEQHVIYVPL